MAHRHDKMNLREVLVNKVLKLNADIETLGGNRIVVNDEGPILTFDAGGSSRNVTLPARVLANDGVTMLIHNISTAGENLVIKNSAASTLLTLPSTGVALVFASATYETPGTREWAAVPIGGEDLALADDLAVTGDLTVTGATALNGTSNRVGSATSHSVGFFGTTVASQRSSSNQTSTNAAVSASFGASQLAILQEIMNTLTAHGIWKGS